MSGFETDRANRTAAWALFEGRLAQVREDLSARSIKGRIAAKAKDDALAYADEAVAVAKDNKGLIAATFAVLLGWFLRGPLLDLARQFANRQGSVQPDLANDGFDDLTEEPVQ